MSLIPAQSSDLSSADSVNIYTLTDGNDKVIKESNDLEDLIAEINENDGTDFTITLNNDVSVDSGFTLNAGKEVTLTSSSAGPFTLTVETLDERHFTVNGTLTLENIILDSVWKEERYEVVIEFTYNTDIGEWVTVFKWVGGYAGGGITVEESGTLVMNKGAVIQNCGASGNGGAVYNDRGTFEMNGGEIANNTTTQRGGGVYNSGVFTMKGGVIANNTTADGGIGGGVSNWVGATFTMTGGEIFGNTTRYGGGVYNAYDVVFTMDGGEIFGNNAENSGGGVYNSDSVFTMDGGEIFGNTAFNGGGVYNAYNAEFTMKKGEIRCNTALYGGGVYNQTATFAMTDGKIVDNTARSGGGVQNDGYSRFTMTDGEISGNTAMSTEYNSGGGGVYNRESSQFEMKNGAISGNTAKNGGGVYNRDGNFTMDGGEISGNIARLVGGGVYSEAGTFEMNVGTISGNIAECGGGVYNRDGNFTMAGGKISGNTANLGGGVYNASHSYYDTLFTMTGGEISGNAATSADSRGSGGGIYTADLAELTVKPDVGKEVIFSGNTAPMLRIKDIGDNQKIYDEMIDDVKLDKKVDVGQNAPAYNNYDINYPGDTYVLFIEITPNGGGTVNVTDSTDRTKRFPLNDGYVYVPDTVNWIALSAEPKKGYVFSHFTLDGSKINKQAGIKAMGNLEFIAEFVFASAQPEHKDHCITATTDGGSMITPSGKVNVPNGENKTFTFSAKPGYMITAVLVDGVPISSAELASGEYTFRDVKSDHTIHVESEADGGSGGGSDIGAGGSGGNDVGSGGNANGEWFAIGMICVMLAVFSGVVALIVRRDRQQKRGA